MPASYIQLAPDGAGKKLRTRQRTIGANTVQEQFLVIGSEPTYYVRSGVVTPILNRLYLCFLNNSGSGQVLKLRRLWIQNAQLTAVTSSGGNVVGMLEFQVKEISAITGGTSVAPVPADTADGVLANYTAVHTATSATEGDVLYSWYSNNDEIGLTGAFPQAMYQQCISSAFNGPEIREITLNPGQGFCVKQITDITGRGQFDVLAVISKES